MTGVGCYSSKDLLNWKFEGIVLPAVKDDPNHDLHPSKVLERPKVVYNKKTGKFVMWAHVESADYSKACAGVAVSDSPVGPFVYQGSFRPNNAMSRDQTVFVDDDGRAYQFYSSENNETMYISLLTDDYLKPSGRFTRNFVKESREAPAVFKYNGKYYLSYSDNHDENWNDGVKGDNRMRYAVSDSPLGPWESKGIYMEPTDSYTNHGSIVEFKGQWYSFYHNSALSGHDWLRSICVDKLYYNPDGTIQIVKQTK